MGHGGRRFFLRRIIYYAVSPLHLKIFYSFNLMSTLRRICDEIPYVVPPPLLGWFTYITLEKIHHNSLRKKPGDFDDEDDNAAGKLKSRGEEEDEHNCPPSREEECENGEAEE